MNIGPQSYLGIIKRFAEKAEMLAAEAPEIFNKGRDIHKIIGIIIIHQAAELALKALCLKQKKTSNMTISFKKALEKTKENFDFSDKAVLNMLNRKRNAYQHSALFDTSHKDEKEHLLYDTLTIIAKLLPLADHEPLELDIVLESFKNVITGNAGLSSIEEV